MSDTQTKNFLAEADKLNDTIERMTALAAMVPEIIGDDLHDHHRDMVRLGVSKMFDGIIKDMQGAAEALSHASHNTSKEVQLRSV